MPQGTNKTKVSIRKEISSEAEINKIENRKRQWNFFKEKKNYQTFLSAKNKYKDSIRNERKDITTKATETERMVRDHYENVYTNKYKTDKKIVMYYLPRWSYEELRHLTIPVVSWNDGIFNKSYLESQISTCRETILDLCFTLNTQMNPKWVKDLT